MVEGTKIGMPLDDFMQRMSDQPFEIINGEIIEMTPTKQQHSKIAKRVYDAILFHLVKIYFLMPLLQITMTASS